MKSIEEIAGVHLGKAGDGSAVKPYQTPDSIDKKLLVGVPRALNRTQYDIDEKNLPFVGYDVWNCYEVSFLLATGKPVCGMVKLRYPSDTPNIVESKSLKLYLNSFNMHKFPEGMLTQLAITEVEDIISQDVGECVGGEVEVAFHHSAITNAWGEYNGIPKLEYHVSPDLQFEHYQEDPSILECISHDENVNFQVCSSLLRSNCRVTNQPDWGDVVIWMEGKNIPTYESMLQYIVSMRRENHFHEEICECIYKRLLDVCKPEHLAVFCLYTRRGGIDINPIRITPNTYFVWLYGDIHTVYKTMRQ